MNLTLNSSCKPFHLDTSALKAVKILVYSLVLIFSFLGNSVIIATVVRNKRMRLSTINYLIANIAASDLLISTIAVPIKLTEIALGPRIWLIDGTVGLVLCKLAFFLQDISTPVSIQSLVVIAFDRYRGIVFPFRPALVTPRRCKFIIPFIWLLSIGLHCMYFYTVRLVSDNDKTLCLFEWAPDFDPRKAQERYMTVLLVIVILLPFLVITVLYCSIIYSLRKEKVSKCLSSPSLSRRHEENIKVFKYICAILIAFSFCFLPIYIYGFFFYFAWKWEMPCNMEQYGFAAHFALYSNAAITPLVNFVFNDRYRKGLKDICKTMNFCHKDPAAINLEGFELNILQPGL